VREIFDFKNDSEEMIVSRILIAIHETINEEFPDASPPPNRFAKTVFSEGESTALNHPDLKVGTDPGIIRRPTAFSSVKNVLFLYFLISLTLLALVVLAFYLGRDWV
jgi:hypothetical protein